MTKAGLGFIASGGCFYLVARQTQIGWLYLFDAIIWSLLVLSAILPWYSLRSLQVDQQVLMPTINLNQPLLNGPLEGEAVEVKLKVTNNGRLARYFIKVLADCPFAEPDERQRAFLLSSLNPRSTTDFSYTATGYRRGYYTSSSIVLQSSGLLGLIVRRRTFRLPLNLTVYPAYYRMEGLPAADTARAEWGHAVKSSAAAELYGSREYQYGDPLKHFHWRNTARLGHFMLKEFEQANQGAVIGTFGTGRDFGAGREATLEDRIKMDASLARFSADYGQSIDIIAGEAPLRNAGWTEAMNYLAHLEAGGKTAFTQLPAAPAPGQVVVAIVPAVETELIPALTQLAGQARGLVVVLLEGFAPGEVPNQSFAELKESDFPIINCSRGNLEGAIERLGNLLYQAGGIPASMG